MRKKTIADISRLNVWIILFAILPIAPGLAQTGGDYILTWSAIDGGGGQSAGRQYVLTGTIGHPCGE
jgi:hypothetical protein